MSYTATPPPPTLTRLQRIVRSMPAAIAFGSIAPYVNAATGLRMGSYPSPVNCYSISTILAAMREAGYKDEIRRDNKKKRPEVVWYVRQPMVAG